MADNNSPTQRFLALWSEVSKSNTWASIAYFLFWDIFWASFCCAWVLGTGIASVTTLAFPPLGYCICILTVMSWRSLARIEIISVSFCTNPSTFISNTIPEISRRASLYPITKISPTNQDYPGCIPFGLEFCYNRYTLDCFYYFAIIKLFTLIAFIICFPVFICISFPPFTLFGFPASCRWCRLFGKVSVNSSRYYLVPGWDHQPGRE
ncbi:hypothetical protein C1645_813264 [Glomus cerebriforme]|uniref:Uncharacterized protein n=1 Tax=Glomus cerebriforme TaxID=658196 RepID=A0A397TT31_9GLOM|nr:hypothetical protein C1645_813264 [Glomus cerebriforme]